MNQNKLRETLYKRIPPEHILPTILFLVIEGVLSPAAFSSSWQVQLGAICSMSLIACFFIWRFFENPRKFHNQSNNKIKAKPSQSISIVEANELDKSPKKNIPDNTFATDDAISFYDKSARYYDDSNSAWIAETHTRVISMAMNNLPASESRILDIGGGTGKFIATNIMQSERVKDIEWVNLDASQKMLEVFVGYMSTGQMRYSVEQRNIFDISKWNVEKKFDVIIICYLLSSLPELPNFNSINNLLSKDGILIIADADPVYSIDKGKKFVILTEESRNILQLNPINPMQIIVSIQDAGFQLNEINIIKKYIPREKHTVDYSYIASFTNSLC